MAELIGLEDYGPAVKPDVGARKGRPGAAYFLQISYACILSGLTRCFLFDQPAAAAH
jgi:hypothetical protein